MTVTDGDGAALPDPSAASASDLAAGLRAAAALAHELGADLVTEDLRLAQYARVAQLGEWLTATAESLHYHLDREVNPDQQLPE